MAQTWGCLPQFGTFAASVMTLSGRILAIERRVGKLVRSDKRHPVHRRSAQQRDGHAESV